jgi:hypothetical protein
MLLLEGKHLAAYGFNVLNVHAYVPVVLESALRLRIELGAYLVEQLVETLGRGSLAGRYRTANRIAVVHRVGRACGVSQLRAKC